jgi:hypothetical protein
MEELHSVFFTPPINNKNSFIYKLHEDDIFSTSLFFEFILEIQKYKELDGQFKIPV